MDRRGGDLPSAEPSRCFPAYRWIKILLLKGIPFHRPGISLCDDQKRSETYLSSWTLNDDCLLADEHSS